MITDLENLLSRAIFGNTVEQYFISLIVFLGIRLAVNLTDRILFVRLRAWAEKTVNKTDDFFVSSCEKYLLPLVRLSAYYFALHILILPALLMKMISSAAVIVLSIQTCRLALAVSVFAIEYQVSQQSANGAKWAASKSMVGILRLLVWGFAGVFVLDNLGFNVSAVVAGLGIGGVAVALAAQTILGDLFNYFVVCFDKPFEQGDFIIVGDFLGEVEHIGIKSTRIRSLSGEQIVFSNTDLTGSRVRNYKRMNKRRCVFKLGIIYETPKEKVMQVPAMLKEIVSSMPDKVVCDRAHFAAFGDFSLNFEVVYYVLSSDYNKYMDVQQEINFKIMESFQKEGIQFAYPTQTVYEFRTNLNAPTISS